ncbi:MAG: hypothetical protein JSW42_07430, partial [Chloroflexota bacterium]
VYPFYLFVKVTSVMDIQQNFIDSECDVQTSAYPCPTSEHTNSFSYMMAVNSDLSRGIATAALIFDCWYTTKNSSLPSGVLG